MRNGRRNGQLGETLAKLLMIPGSQWQSLSIGNNYLGWVPPGEIVVNRNDDQSKSLFEGGSWHYDYQL
jgi:hypothetical protein